MSIHDDLKAYLDGELEPGRAEEVRQAIESDPALKREAEFMRSLGDEIRAVSIDPQVYGLERALDAVQPKNPWWGAPAWRTGLAIGVPILAGLAIVALLGKGLMTGQKEESAEVAMSESALELPNKSAANGSLPQEVKSDAKRETPAAADSTQLKSTGDRAENQRKTTLDIEVDDPAAAFSKAKEIAGKYQADVQEKLYEQRATITVPLKDAGALIEELNEVEPNAKVSKPQDQENESAGQPRAEDKASIDVTFRTREVPPPVKPREMIQPDGVAAPEDEGMVWLIAIPASIILLGGIWFAMRRR